MRARAPERAARIGALGLALLGTALLAQGAWIPAKAWLAQRLIEHAWERGRGTSTVSPAPRPWPWADTWPVARLSREADPGSPLYVLAGASGEALAFGPGHVSSSAPPASDGHVVLAGHRDTHFAFLRTIRAGDRLVLETHTSRRLYVVEVTRVVHESRADLLDRTGRAELTLITCYPFDAIVPGGPLRYAVHARALDSTTADLGGDRVPSPPVAAERTARADRRPWKKEAL